MKYYRNLIELSSDEGAYNGCVRAPFEKDRW